MCEVRLNINSQLIIAALKFTEFPDHVSKDYGEKNDIQKFVDIFSYVSLCAKFVSHNRDIGLAIFQTSQSGMLVYF